VNRKINEELLFRVFYSAVKSKKSTLGGLTDDLLDGRVLRNECTCSKMAQLELELISCHSVVTCHLSQLPRCPLVELSMRDESCYLFIELSASLLLLLRPNEHRTSTPTLVAQWTWIHHHVSVTTSRRCNEIDESVERAFLSPHLVPPWTSSLSASLALWST
jgi:hypothetical protein